MNIRTHRSRRLTARLVRRVVIIGLAAGTLAPISSSADTNQVFSEVATLSRMPDDARKVFGEGIVPPGFFAPLESFDRTSSPSSSFVGTLLSIPDSGEVWQIFPYYDNGAKTGIAVRDVATLKMRRTVVVDSHLKRGGLSAFGGDWMAAFDGTRRAFFYAVDQNAVLSVDTATMAVKRFPLLGAMAYSTIGGMSYDPHSDRVLLAYSVFGNTAALNAYTLIYSIDLKSGVVEGPRPMRSCNAPLPSTEGNKTYAVSPYVANKDYIYVPCQRSGNSGAVVRVPRTGIMDPSSAEDIAVGPTNLETVLEDPGTGRLFLVTFRGEIWAFDTASMSFVGVIAANAESNVTAQLGYGVDPATGRVFFLSPTFGLGVAEGRFFPIPQAKTRPELAAPGQERIFSDSTTGRVFVLTGEATGKDYVYRIYQAGQAPVPPPNPDPDANTSDQPELKGVTEGRYNAAASGYGARVLMANGVTTVVPAPAAGELAPTADVLSKNLNAKCGFTDRELVAGRVLKTEADTGSNAAVASAIEIDPRTRLDMDRPSRCEPYGKHQGTDYLEAVFTTTPEPLDNTSTTPRWNYTPAQCSASEGGKAITDDGETNGGVALGANDVECPLPGGKLVASAEAKLAGVVSVGKAKSSTKITRDGEGVHSVAESFAGDIEIGEGIRIAEIRSIATSDSNGRPAKDAMSRHTINIRGLSISGKDVCTVCNTQEVVDTLNRALAGRAQFRIGTQSSDGRLLRGSRRGALSAVQKSPERQVSDQSLIGDFTTEVPGLEMIVYNDNSKWGRARQLYQFAGVASSATYNIVGVPKGFGFVPSSDGGGTGDGTVIETGGTDGTVNSVDLTPTVPDGVSSGDSDGGGFFDGVRRAALALARGFRLFFSDPRHGVLLLTGWGLFSLPVWLYRRRVVFGALD